MIKLQECSDAKEAILRTVAHALLNKKDVGHDPEDFIGLELTHFKELVFAEIFTDPYYSAKYSST